MVMVMRGGEWQRVDAGRCRRSHESLGICVVVQTGTVAWAAAATRRRVGARVLMTEVMMSCIGRVDVSCCGRRHLLMMSTQVELVMMMMTVQGRIVRRRKVGRLKLGDSGHRCCCRCGCCCGTRVWIGRGGRRFVRERRRRLAAATIGERRWRWRGGYYLENFFNFFKRSVLDNSVFFGVSLWSRLFFLLIFFFFVIDRFAFFSKG